MNKAKQILVRRDKQIDLVSRLTFIKGLKDAPETYVYKEKEQKEKKKKKYKHWCMPVQLTGYIKCRAHDLL